MGSASDLQTIVYVARLAEQATSYYDMVNEIINLPKMDMELTEEERLLLSVEYRNIIRPRRNRVKEMSSREHDARWMKKYKRRMAELDSICRRILYVINNHLIPRHIGVDSTVFYYKLKGDYNRIRAELRTDDNRKTFVYRSEYAYEVATKAVNPELPSTHHIRLGLALNFAKFYDGILNSPERAYLLVQQALDAAESDLNTLNEEPHKYTISAMKRLRCMQATMAKKLEEKSKSGQEEKPGCSTSGEIVCSTSREIVPQLAEGVAAVKEIVPQLAEGVAAVKDKGIISHIDRGINSADERVSYTVRGLANLGNTCYFNAIVQNLLAINSLRDYFCKLDEYFGPISDALKKLFLDTNTGTGSTSAIEPRSLLDSLCTAASQFKGSQHHDSHELLRCLLDRLSAEERGDPPKRALTIVDAIFGGQLSTTITCLECSHSSTRSDSYSDLSLPVPIKNCPVSVESCLALFMEPEMLLSSVRDWKCESCSNVMREKKVGSENLEVARDAIMTTLINKAPLILTIHLKRFYQDVRGCFRKSDGAVSFTTTIDLKPYMVPRSNERERFTYHLVGVVEHEGTTELGHYFTFVRATRGKSDIWYRISDKEVRRTSITRVMSSAPYILFYERD